MHISDVQFMKQTKDQVIISTLVELATQTSKKHVNKCVDG